jgi:hypothetical protein
MLNSYMNEFSFLARNADRFAQSLDLSAAVAVSDTAVSNPKPITLT